MKVLLIFTYLIFYSIGVLPNWNIEKSSINLLTSDSYNYIITHRVMYDLEAKLEKYIIRLDNGTITHYNQLYINGEYKGKVSFENIETFYLINGRKLLCPMGKFHPINLVNMEEIENNIGYTFKNITTQNTDEIISRGYSIINETLTLSKNEDCTHLIEITDFQF